ncbi:ChrR family anti-sigma-E factor [Psychromonas sp. MME2]|uniref:ChrR family anti-sigma-E factor n=1 Tax=unclassified Psychromonas TaxID=2614957 RepID=UPI00339BE30A
MIKHHPTQQLLILHSEGHLPFSLAVAVSAHIEMCEHCQKKSQQLTQSLASQTWQENSPTVDFSDMLQNILQSELPEVPVAAQVKNVTTYVSNKTFNLPRAFRSFKDIKWSGLGPVSRARIVKDEDNIRSNLLHIDKNGVIPSHSHKGYEVTLLLDGSFADEHGSYHKGDFIWLEGGQQHSPFSESGCLCYAVQNAPLHFTSGISKVLNPLGKLIY